MVEKSKKNRKGLRDMARLISVETGYAIEPIEDILKSFFDISKDLVLNKDGLIMFKNFGSLYAEPEVRSGYNFQTKKKILYEKTILKFKPYKACNIKPRRIQ